MCPCSIVIVGNGQTCTARRHSLPGPVVMKFTVKYLQGPVIVIRCRHRHMPWIMFIDESGTTKPPLLNNDSEQYAVAHLNCLRGTMRQTLFIHNDGPADSSAGQ